MGHQMLRNCLNRQHWLMLGLALVATQPGCNKSETAAAPAAAAAKQSQEVVLSVHAAAVVAQKLPPMLDLTGTLAADESSEVAAPTPGIVTEVTVDVGSRVTRGQVIAHIDRRDAAMREAQAAAATAQAAARAGVHKGDSFSPHHVPEVQVAHEALELADTEAKRAKALVEGGSAPQSMLDQAKARAEQARGQYDSALSMAQQAFSGLQAAKAAQELTAKAVNDTDVRAPFDGVVTEKRIAPGEYAQMGRVIAVIVRDRPLRLKLDVPEVDAAKILPGAQVEVTVAAYPGRVFLGTVKRIGAALKAQARALPIEAEIDNESGELHPGFFAKASIRIPGPDQDALLVPAAAIGFSGSASRVFVVRGDRAEEQIISVGQTTAQGLVPVRGTLKAGELLATEKVDQLNDGIRISVVK